jgi:D-alanine-D-alanine ligase
LKKALLFGGNSYEHEISIVSAIALKKVIKKELIFIFLDESGEFWLIDDANMKSTYFAKREYRKAKKLFLLKGGFHKKTLFGFESIGKICVINLVHGGDGEDGRLASMFDFYGVSFVGPRTEVSVLSFNKLYTKALADMCGVKALAYSFVTKKARKFAKPDAYPVIVKPCRLGSSIGISVVKSEKELDYALDVAFEFDDAALIEPFVENVREFNVAGARVGSEIVYSNIEEPKKEGYLDFEKKYLDFSRTQEVAAAGVEEQLAAKLKESFAKIYSFGFDGAIIRCDFFVVDNEVYLNEVNPIPGSLANYLFGDFNALLEGVSHSLPTPRRIKVDYKYINKIKSAKGKL